MQINGSWVGNIQFSANSGTAPTLTFPTTGLTIAGDIEVTGSQGGTIAGSTNSALPTIISSTGVIDGRAGTLTISGNIANHGTIMATSTGTVDVTAKPSGGSSGTWKVTASGATLKFSPVKTIYVAGGEILVEAGNLHVNKAFNFYGGLKYTGGDINCTSATFNALGRYIP